MIIFVFYFVLFDDVKGEKYMIYDFWGLLFVYAKGIVLLFYVSFKSWKRLI